MPRATLFRSAGAKEWASTIDGGNQLLALELCGGESVAAWKGCLDDLVARGLRAPVLAVIDGKVSATSTSRNTSAGPGWARA